MVRCFTPEDSNLDGPVQWPQSARAALWIDGHRLPAGQGVLRAFGQNQRSQAVDAVCQIHRFAIEAPQKPVHLYSVGVPVALQEERRNGVAVGTGRSGRPDVWPRLVSRLQHAGRTEHFDALVVAMAAVSRVVDRTKLAALGLEQCDGAVDIAALADAPVEKYTARGEYEDGFFSKQPARHVEIMNHHVPEQAA